MSRHGDRDEPEEHGSSNERWLVSYADFITLMFAFFTVLYATSEKNMEKTKQFQDSVKRFLIKAGAFGESGQQINQGDKHDQPIESPIQSFHPEKPQAATAVDEAQTFLESHMSAGELHKYVLDVHADDWGVRLVLPSSTLFAAGTEKFRPEAVPFIDKLSLLLSQTKRKVLIEGHVAPSESGDRGSTWDFASARAVNMLRFLQKKRHIDGERLVAASFGDSRPLFEGKQAARNSRLEIVLLNPDSGF
jgi:chemotaxis protein MotB